VVCLLLIQDDKIFKHLLCAFCFGRVTKKPLTTYRVNYAKELEVIFKAILAILPAFNLRAPFTSFWLYQCKKRLSLYFQIQCLL